jgi:hypothetical protein
MKATSMVNFFKMGVMFALFMFGACSTEESDGWLERPDNFGESLYERHLKKGTSAAFECTVYSRDNHVTLEMNLDLVAYQSELSAVYDVEVGEPTYYYVDLVFTGMFQDEAPDFCEGIKKSVDGMKTSCSKSSVKGKAELVDVSAAASSLMLGNMVTALKSQCDDFYDAYKEQMAEFPGRWSYGDGSEVTEPALLCDVNVSADTLYMNVDYSTRSMSMVVTHYNYNGAPTGSFMVLESYAGVSPDTLANVCNAYRQESDISGVYCEGSTISYLAPEAQEGQILTLEDMAVVYKKEVCPGLLDGSLSMEDLWFND